jgi:hypothetical protein
VALALYVAPHGASILVGSAGYKYSAPTALAGWMGHVRDIIALCLKAISLLCNLASLVADILTSMLTNVYRHFVTFHGSCWVGGFAWRAETALYFILHQGLPNNPGRTRIFIFGRW